MMECRDINVVWYIMERAALIAVITSTLPVCMRLGAAAILERYINSDAEKRIYALRFKKKGFERFLSLKIISYSVFMLKLDIKSVWGVD